MNRQVSWKILLAGGVLSYALESIIGGVIGDLLGALGLVLILLGIIGLFRAVRNKKVS